MRALRTALLVLLLSVVGTIDMFADGFDYAEVCPSGQTLYYKIDPDDPNGVIVVPPYNYSFPDYYEFWGEGYERPAGDLVIPETLSNGLVVKKIGCFRSNDRFVGAFQDCTELTSVTIGNSVTTVDDCSFYSCTNLTSVIVGNSVASIGTYAFKGCTSLTTLVLPNSLNKFEYSAFADCTNLSSITIPDAVMSISMNVFANTAWYNSQSDGVLYLDTWCLGYKGEKPMGALDIREGTRGISWKAFDDCSDITSVTFPNSLVSIVEYAFCETGLTGTLTIPKSVAYIGNEAFEECSNLTTIYYNAENATGGGAFRYCSNLATIIVGPDVRYINGRMFERCNTAHLVVALGSIPAVLGSGAFSELADDAMFMVPCGKKMTYYSQWNMFPYDNIIENCDQMPVSMGNISAGGSITASTSSAQLGEEVQLTVTPNAGMALESIAICNASDPTQTIPYYFKGKSSKIYFVMPSFAVTVNAKFKQSGSSVGENSVTISVYPNPTLGIVKIEAEKLRHISVFNMIGQQIFNGLANGDEFEIDFSGHEPGVYLIRIETANGITTKRVALTK